MRSEARDLPSSNAQHDQFDKSDTDQQHSKRHGIVFEPMPIIGRHHVHPYSNAVLFHDHRRDLHWDADHTYHFRERATVLLINIYRTPVSGVLRRKDSGFAVCGENLASVSQFVAGIRHGRSFKQEHDRARWVVGVGREGYWSGAERVTKMAEWPDWNPPEEMIVRQPYLRRFMAGGETNPLCARALYLGKTVSGRARRDFLHSR